MEWFLRTTDGTLYAIQCITKDIRHRSQSPVYKNRTQELCKVGNAGQVSARSSTDSISHDTLPSKSLSRNQKQRGNLSKDTALVHKVHPNDRPLRNNVPERAKSRELDDILAKWNIHKPNK
ncbi:uncharacterized protein LOC128890793 isoform X2 [Hylaeus anthracinus]|uniref:uncharacterized protein LOC128890793 isoform X2 n=1 Tax=Hylaeus anthracinus TaxID=313031 RepID=UPI0023BA12B0|nr:uncharacterized protein LOC128890793 isoform X2 [Hylaeus anthracinus]